MIEFFPCLGGNDNDCHYEEAVMDTLRNSNYVVLHNQVKFDQNVFGAESIVQESRIITEPLDMVWNRVGDEYRYVSA